MRELCGQYDLSHSLGALSGIREDINPFENKVI